MQTQLYIYLYLYIYLADTEFSASILLCSKCYHNQPVPLGTESDSQKNGSEQSLKKSGQSQQKQLILAKSLVPGFLTEASSLSLLLFFDLEKLVLQLQSKNWCDCAVSQLPQAAMGNGRRCPVRCPGVGLCSEGGKNRATL